MKYKFRKKTEIEMILEVSITKSKKKIIIIIIPIIFEPSRCSTPYDSHSSTTYLPTYLLVYPTNTLLLLTNFVKKKKLKIKN